MIYEVTENYRIKPHPHGRIEKNLVHYFKFGNEVVEERGRRFFASLENAENHLKLLNENRFDYVFEAVKCVKNANIATETYGYEVLRDDSWLVEKLAAGLKSVLNETDLETLIDNLK